MSGSVISIEDFRKTAALLGDEAADDDSDRARQVLHKHLLRMLAEARTKDLGMGSVSMALFVEAVSALSANGWSADEIVTWVRELEADDFFNDDDEENEDE